MTIPSTADLIRLRNAVARLALDLPSGTSSVAPVPADTGDRTRAIELWRTDAPAILAALPSRSCPACDGTESRHVFTSCDGHEFHECAACGAWFAARRIDDAVFERFLDAHPEAREIADRSAGEAAIASRRDEDMGRFGRYVDEVLMLLPPARRRRALLDTACGTGFSLRAARARGLNVQGVERSAAAVAAADADGLNVVGPDQPVPGGPYHIIGFWDSLARVPDPLHELLRYMPLLDEGGVVTITLPNLNALETRVGREASPAVYGGFNAPGNVNLLHEPAVDRLLARAGLAVLDVRGELAADPSRLVSMLVGPRDSANAGPRPTAEWRRALETVWQGVALVEAGTLTSPMLHVVACRAGSEALFTEAIRERRRLEEERRHAAAAAMIAEEPDYPAQVAALTEEVARHAASVASLQRELDRLHEAERARLTSGLMGRLRRGKQLAGGVARRLGLR